MNVVGRETLAGLERGETARTGEYTLCVRRQLALLVWPCCAVVRAATA